MSIFKECDIRGVYDTELTIDDALLIGKAVGTILQGENIVVGGDSRNSTPVLKEALIKGLVSTGADVIDIGEVPTPIVYFAKREFRTRGAVMVTASHNPSRYNGFKIIMGDMPLTPEQIYRIRDLTLSRCFRTGEGHYERSAILPQYAEMIRKHIPAAGSLKMVVDCGNGITSILAPGILEEMGHSVVPLFCECDGDFPNRDPNPSVEKNLLELKRKVVEHKADIGIAFDGDGDRVIFIDDKGRFCSSESVFIILCRHYLSQSPEKKKIVFDGKAASNVKKSIELYNGIPLPERSGHAFIKKRFIEEQAVLAGEVSGHFFFSELGYDDGLFGALKFCEILLKNNEKLSNMIDKMEKPLITEDIRIYYEENERERLLKHINQKGSDYSLSYLDGVRVDYPFGWIIVRKSVTEPCVTVRLEAESLKDAKRITSHLFAEKYKDIGEQILSSLLNRK
ncbi:MAG: phosphomannomutase/phosphoglucomutase [Sphaerochaetaceae bacterium]|nr:phosphomannomutase/phosphoglucomutase [Sphaerochaetaceae bacterium]